MTSPSSPTQLTVVSVGASTISLAWKAAKDNKRVAGYAVYRDNVRVLTTSGLKATIGRLTCGTSYRVGVAAFDAAGNVSRSSALITSTRACADTQPPTVPGAAEAVTRTTTALAVTWAPSTDNVGVVSYDVFLEGAKAGATATTSFAFGGLQCDRNYSIGVRAVDGAGNASVQATALISTAPCPDVVAPTPPPGLVVSGHGQSSLTLAWGASSDAGGVVAYGVYRDGALIATTKTPGSTVSGLACGTTHTLAVDAVDAAGNRSPRASVVGTTDACTPAPAPPSSPSPDTTSPSSPSLSISATAPTAITVAWTTSTDNVGVAGYGVYVGTTRVASTTSLSKVVAGLSCGTAYTIGVDAFDAAGNRSPQSSVVASTAPCADTTPPAAPSGLSLTVANETSLGLSWNAATDNVGVVGYGIYQAGLRVDEISGRSYVLTGLTCGTTYSVAVDAVDGAGNRSTKASVFVSTAACPDTTPPSAPAGLASTGSSTSSLSLSWAPSTDNVGVTAYGLYLNGTQSGVATGTSATFGNLACGTSYTLAVDAVDAAGNRSARSTLVAGTGACPAPAPPPATSANLLVSPSGNDTTCLRNAPGAPCATLAGAYAKAQAGDVVEIAAGSYAAQRLGPRTLGTADVIFRPASGATVSVADLSVHASHVEIQGISIAGGSAIEKDPSTGARPSFVTYRSVSAQSLFIAADDVNLIGGSYGGFDACNANALEDGIEVWLSGTTASSRVTIDGITVHDVSDHGDGCAGTAQSSRHVDCIQVLDGHYITIRNSRFYGCATSNILARPYTAGLDHVTVENNFFAPPVRAGNNVYLGGPSDTCTNVVYRYNTSPGSGVTGGCSDPVSAYGNVMQTSACVAGVAYSDNVFLPGSTQCGTNPRQCPVAFASPSSTTADFHLLAGDTCARDALHAPSYPAADIDGQPRPAGAGIDAGADEAG